MNKRKRATEIIFSYTVLIGIIAIAIMVLIVLSRLFFEGMGFTFEKKVSIYDYITLLGVIVTGVLSYGIFNLTKKMNDFVFFQKKEAKENIRKKSGVYLHSMAKSLVEIETSYDSLYELSKVFVENPISYTHRDIELAWRQFNFFTNKIMSGINNWNSLYKNLWDNPDMLAEIYEHRDTLLDQDHYIRVIDDRFKIKFLESQTMDNLKKYNEYICEC
ncbi:hypothetical protein [Paenibacillus endoradicis]|uniref:hypothetical protein n=1 Tax=Paenibacillus endoradicis TaxID=2972487 RepID=UPI002159545E|nr:hypothetical protein [Paenibacillus endoradicis]MCR8660177.1 hypothetical protein [Paenibacillus endoradicis]